MAKKHWDPFSHLCYGLKYRSLQLFSVFRIREPWSWFREFTFTLSYLKIYCIFSPAKCLLSHFCREWFILQTNIFNVTQNKCPFPKLSFCLYNSPWAPVPPTLHSQSLEDGSSLLKYISIHLSLLRQIKLSQEAQISLTLTIPYEYLLYVCSGDGT